MGRDREPAWQRCARHPDVYFTDFDRARLHYENSCSDYWCSRCSKAFPSYNARDQHIENSPSHSFKCDIPSCRFNAANRESLHGHWNETGHNILCKGCSTYIRSDIFDNHLSTYNGCKTCHRHFGSANERKMHEITHQPPTHKCYGKGCGRMFHTLSGMFIHLESGACVSTITVKDVNAVIALHPNTRDIILDDCNRTLLAFLNRAETPNKPFKCPGDRCGETFAVLSAMIQHQESENCNGSFGKTPAHIIPFLQRNLHLENAASRIETLDANVRGNANITVFTDNTTARESVRDLYPKFFKIQNALCQCLDRVQASRVLDSLGTAGLLYKPILTNGIDLQLATLEVAVAEFQQKYEAAFGAYTQSPPRLVILFEATSKTQMAGLFMREVSTVLRILRLEGRV